MTTAPANDEPIPIWFQRTAMAVAMLFCATALADSEWKSHLEKNAKRSAEIASKFKGGALLCRDAKDPYKWRHVAVDPTKPEDVATRRSDIGQGVCVTDKAGKPAGVG